MIGSYRSLNLVALFDLLEESSFLALVFRLDQEIALVSMSPLYMLRSCPLVIVIVGLQVYPAPWNVVKFAYIFCRYYPMVIAPFHFWGFLGNHEQSVCESYYHALYVCTIPMVRPLILPI